MHHRRRWRKKKTTTMTASRPVPTLAMPLSREDPPSSDRTHDTRIVYKPLFRSVAAAFNEPRGTYISASSCIPFVPVRRNDGSARTLSRLPPISISRRLSRNHRSYFRVHYSARCAPLPLSILPRNNPLRYRYCIRKVSISQNSYKANRF